MKIFVLTHAFPPQKGGFSSYAYEIARHWIRAGIEVNVFSTVPPDDDDGFDAEMRPHVTYLETRSYTVPENFRVFVRFMKIAIREKADVVFFPVWLPYSIFMALLSWLPFRNIRYVIGCHGADVLGMYPKSSHPVSPLVKLLGRMTLRRAAALFVVSNYTAEKVRRLGVDSQKIKVFPNGVDYRKFRQVAVDRQALLRRYQIPDSETTVLLTVSQFNRRKGIDTAIQVVHRLTEMGEQIIYLIIGSGEMEAELIALIEKYDLKERVFILKHIDDETLIRFYNISDIFLLLSRQVGDINVEGFGIVFLEANACGLPVIAGNSGGIPDAVEDGKSGFLVDPQDPQLIGEKVRYLIHHPREAKAMGAYGRERVETIYNWKRITGEMLAALEETLTNRGR